MRPEHIAAKVADVLQKTSGARAIGIRLSVPWTHGELLTIAGTRYPVVYCMSTLAVREALDRHAAEAPPLVLLTPLADEELGWDVLVRLAKRQLHEPDLWEIACGLFRAQSVDSRITAHRWIGEVLVDRAPSKGYSPVPGGVLDADTAWLHVFAEALGINEPRPDAAAIIEASLGPDFVARFIHIPIDARSAVRARVEETAGRLGGLLMAAVESGHAPLLLPIGLVCEVLFPGSAQPGPELTRAAVRLEQYAGGMPIDPPLGHAWSAAARDILATLSDADAVLFLRQAEDLLRELRADAFVTFSTALPSSYQRRLEAFAHSIDACLSGGDIAVVRDTLAALGAHRDFGREDQENRRERLYMAARLTRFLNGRRNEAASAHRSLADAARDYAAELSWVDSARTALIGGDEAGALAVALNRLNERVRDVREQENHRFAELLAEWNRSPSSERELLPIERVLDDVAAPGAAKGNVLVLLLDGMNFAIFRQLRQEIRRARWEEWIPSGRNAATLVLAASPCVTRISRASLFAGRIAPGGAADERRGFEQNERLLATSRPTKRPLLFHKGDLASGSAAALDESVRTAIQDSEQRVVGLILNVLDDSLSSSDQLRPRWTLDRVPLLQAILYEAGLAGRLVVLTSDHGHLLEAETSLLGGGEDERWRPYAEPIAPEEVVLAGPRVQAATGQPRIVVPWSERVRYVRKRTGYHGGATPQEMLVPVAVFAPWDRPVEGWSVAPEARPAWWGDREEAVVERPPKRPRPKPARGQTRAAAVQASLFSEPSRSAETETSWIVALLASDTLAAQSSMAGRLAPQEEVVRGFLETLDQHGGRVRRNTLARALNLPELRLRGVLAGLQRVLNVDGYPIVTSDDATDTVELHRDLLRKQFAIETRSL